METEKKDIDTTYDEISKNELEKRLKRPAKENEIINADTDSDLVNEVFWQLIKQMDQRIKDLEDKLLSKDKDGVV